MRVVLLYPEVYDMARFAEQRKEFPPFGVLYLAAVMEDAGHDVAVRKVTPHEPDLDLSGFEAVGFSLASSATYGILRQARRASRIDSDALVMVGGVHANFYPEESLVDFDADVMCEGESEHTILEVLDRAVTSRAFGGITGTLWTNGEQVHREPPRRLIGDIDCLPLPARHLLPTEDFLLSDRLAGRDLRMAHVMFSRGCPFPCSFCAAGQTRIQYRSGVSAHTELVHLIERYGVEGFAIVDDNFIVNKRKVSDICEQITDLGLSWSALSRVDTIDLPLLKTMAAAGCIEIKYGVESGSEALLKAMRKNTTRAQIKRAFAATADAGIEAKAFIIHGFPGENTETTAETMSLLQELGTSLSRVSLFRFVPLPGTQVYADPDRHNLHGAHTQPDWDGDWSKFHIHHNDRHWWGTPEQWQDTEDSYRRLRDFVETHWNRQG
ncbi:B12-binding domain-containing radical SAM protein [Frankia sp. Cas4]|uniref:B12-binding domain-containing radical SAM protein n=1 Tax=Frankia sp. Cas4 TaxID=3073927 RepID=UPI002AD58D62|nr:radical SAM protein [Frankia sp. Cas4]